MDIDPTEDAAIHSFFISSSSSARISSINVAPGDKVRRGAAILSYSLVESNDSVQSDCSNNGSVQQLKSTLVGVVREILYREGEIVPAGATVVAVEAKCDHSVVVYDLCTDCGLNLRQGKTRTKPGAPNSDRISMVHGVPEIQISRQEAEVLANKDKDRLLQNRKLALIIDLDQTLIHTSVDPKIEPGLPDVYGFKLPGHAILYHCRLRPYARQFLRDVSKYYETHVFTMGTKLYAASVTHILDPDKKLFYGRIISRDDCFDPHSKALRLKYVRDVTKERSVFPCGDAMVAIIDDREDVWGRCPNLIHVKPYVFFAGTADINAPPGSHSMRSHPHKNHTSQKPHPPQGTHPHSSQSTRPTEQPNTPPTPLNTETALPPRSTRPQDALIQTALTDAQTPIDPKTKHAANSHKASVEGSHPSSIEARTEDGSSPSSSDSEDSSSSTSSSDVDDTVFDELENSSPGKLAQAEITSGIGPVNEGPLSEVQDNTGVNMESADQGEGAVEETPKERKSGQIEMKTAQTGTETLNQNETCEVAKNESVQAGIETAQNQSETAQPGIEVAKRAHDEEMDTETTKISDEQEIVQPTEVPSANHRKINDPDNFLLHLTDTLKRVHKTYYSEYDSMSQSEGQAAPDLKQIIPKIRHSVLKGTKILFTGVIPTNMPVEKSPEWNTARAFGASIHDRFVYGLTSSTPKKAMQATTHVIAGRPGTSKLREARRIQGVKIVNPRWLWGCAEQWKLVDEREFPVKFEEGDLEKKPPTKTPKLTSQRPKAGAKKAKKTGQNDVFTETPQEESTVVPGNPDKQSPRVPERHMSIESALSVSDEELERMNAEVDAEIVSSSSSESEKEPLPELGTLIERMDDDVSLSYDNFAGNIPLGGRKRKHDDVSSSSDNNSPVSTGLLEESVDISERESSDSESGDELAELLGGT